MKFFAVRSNTVIVSACAGTIPGLLLLSVLDLPFISQHCHNWCAWLEAEKSIVCFPPPQRLKGLGTECLSPAETHSTYQHHFMGLCLPLSVHKSACQVPLPGWGWSSPEDGPAFPEAELSLTHPLQAQQRVGRKLGIHSPHRSHLCLPAPLGTAGGIKTDRAQREYGHSSSLCACAIRNNAICSFALSTSFSKLLLFSIQIPPESFPSCSRPKYGDLESEL